jgi:hypothetical protein
MSGCSGSCAGCPFAAIEEEIKKKMKEQSEKEKKD